MGAALPDPRGRLLRWCTALAAVAVVAASFAPREYLLTAVADTTGHVLAFALLAWLAAECRLLPRRPAACAASWIVVALALEGAQGLLTTDRVASATDAAASMAGVGAGLLAARASSRWEKMLAAYAVVVAALGLTFALEAVRPKLTDTLLRIAWREAQRQSSPRAPWPGAPGNVAFALSLPGEARPIVVLDAGHPAALAVAPGVSPEGARFGGRGVVVVLGHRNKAFSSLSKLAIGDTIAVASAGGAELAYAVKSLEVVPWDRSELRPWIDAQQLALVTCWPVDGRAKTPLRLVVRAERVAAGAPRSGA